MSFCRAPLPSRNFSKLSRTETAQSAAQSVGDASKPRSQIAKTHLYCRQCRPNRPSWKTTNPGREATCSALPGFLCSSCGRQKISQGEADFFHRFKTTAVFRLVNRVLPSRRSARHCISPARRCAPNPAHVQRGSDRLIGQNRIRTLLAIIFHRLPHTFRSMVVTSAISGRPRWWRAGNSPHDFIAFFTQSPQAQRLNSQIRIWLITIGLALMIRMDFRSVRFKNGWLLELKNILLHSF